MRLHKKKDQPRTVGRQRRNTGSWQKPATFSYAAQRAEREDGGGRRQQSSLAQKRSRLLSLRFWLRRSGLLAAVIVGFICLISILSVSTQPRIILLNDDTNKAAFHSTEAYQQEASKQLSSSFWNRNKITVNTGAASEYLQKKFPELEEVTVTLPLVGHRPIYYLKANNPAFVMQAVNGTFVLDAGGKALLAKALAAPQTVANLPVITDQTGITVQAGKQVLSSQKTRFIRTVIDTLAAKQVAVESLTLPTGAVQELDVRLKGLPYVVKFNMHDDTTARQQVGTYLATSTSLAGQRITPAQYIDVRVLGRAYYQ